MSPLPSNHAFLFRLRPLRGRRNRIRMLRISSRGFSMAIAGPAAFTAASFDIVMCIIGFL